MGDEMARVMMAWARAEEMSQAFYQAGSSTAPHRPVAASTMLSELSSVGAETPTSPEQRVQSQPCAAFAAVPQQRPPQVTPGQAGCFYDQVLPQTAVNATTTRAAMQEADQPGPKRRRAASPCGEQSNNASPAPTSTQDHSKQPTGDVWKPIGSGIPLHKIGVFPVAEGEVQIFARLVPTPPPFPQTGGFQARPTIRPSHAKRAPVPTARFADHSLPPPEPKC